MKTKTAQIAWVLQRLFDALDWAHRGRGGGGAMIYCGRGGIENTLIYDDGIDFIYGFAEAFPGRTKNDRNKQARTGKILGDLFRDGWIDRSVKSNFKEYYGEGGNWFYHYSLPHDLALKVKEGKTTCEAIARKIMGDWEGWEGEKES